MGETNNIRIFQTAEHTCGYWPERLASDLVLDPTDPTLPRVYERALTMGFRRSGGHVYRPHCLGCNACIPVRIPVQEFRPNRNQRRCLSHNADITIKVVTAGRTEEIFSLYRHYVGTRHAGGGMDDPLPEDFDKFLTSAWSTTLFLELCWNNELLGVAVTDVLPNALSSVYTFYAPEHAERSLGTFAILAQIEHARQQKREHLYLGFWLDAHPKMHYKRNFKPLEYFDGREWQRFL